MTLLRFPARGLAAAVVTLALTQFGCVRTVYVRRPPPTAVMPPPPPPVQATVVVEDDGTVIEDFYEPLGYYGAWVDVAPYGRVWQPASDMAGQGFRPYGSDGYWAASADGDWHFVSRYHSQWGWATYHYGRWAWNDLYGWVWIPGRRWAPSWVEWRYGGGYVGWAPMGPPGVVIVEQHFVFVNRAHIGSADVYNYRIPPERAHGAYVAAAPAMGGAGGQGQPYIKPGPPLADLRAAGVLVAGATVKPPERGYVKTQGRLVAEGAGERKASGRVVTEPHVRGDMSARGNSRAPGDPTPPPPPAAGRAPATQPGYYPPSSPAGRADGADEPRYYPASPPGSRPGGPSSTPAPARPSPSPVQPSLPSARTPPTPAQPPTTRTPQAPAQPTAPSTRPSPTPQPPSATPRAAPKPSATTTSRKKPAPKPAPKPRTL